MPPRIAYSEEQLAAIMRAAEPLAPADRERFFEAVTAAMQGQAVTAAMQGRELGDGAVYLAIREAQRQFSAPPVDDPPRRPGGKAA